MVVCQTISITDVIKVIGKMVRNVDTRGIEISA